MQREISEQQKLLNEKFKEFISKQKSWKVLPDEFYSSAWLKLDLGRNNPEVKEIGLKESMLPLGGYIDGLLTNAGSKVGIGGWQEDRALYEMSSHFDKGTVSRSIHLGVDLWFQAGTPIYCPLKGKIQSFQNNANFLDYGPTIIVEHEISDNFTFYSLYGHLSAKSLENKKVGQTIEKGELLAWLGSPPENGDWPPHLHFQILLDLLNNSGDYPGVSSVEDKDFYACICPDPSFLLANL